MQYGVVLTVECALSSATGQPAVLNVNSTFESGITPWIPRFSTISQSAAWSQEDSYSLKVTPDGVSVRGYAESENIPVLPGQSYVAAGYVNMTSSWTGGFSFSVNWFNAGGTYISTSSNDNFSMPSGVSSQSNLFTAPANAYYATLVPTMNGTPPASQMCYGPTSPPTSGRSRRIGGSPATCRYGSPVRQRSSWTTGMLGSPRATWPART